MFKKKKKAVKFINNDYILISQNNMIDICTDACSVCWDKAVPEDFEKREKYISARTRIGHESVIEHSNLVLLLQIKPNQVNDLIEVLSNCRYLNTDTKYYDNKYYLLIGGSIRGYKHIYKNIENMNNAVLAIITRALYENCSYSFFEDFINDEIFDKNKFIELAESPTSLKPVKSIDEKHIELANVDQMSDIIIFSGVDDILPSLQKIGFDLDTVFGMLSVTILFKDISRTSTHQLVRHRDAITQESQRYVDYSNAGFASPDKFKDKYDSNHKYRINTLNGDFTLSELGTELTKIYGELKEFGLDKEDARGYLPSNIECGRIYLTFTYKTLSAFLKLRTAKNAQAEIRYFATVINNSLIDAGIIDEDFMNKFGPRYLNKIGNELYSDIDEVVK